MKTKTRSSNPYSGFKYSKIEAELLALINKECSLEVMKKFIEYDLPPVAAFSADVEEIFEKNSLKNAFLRNQLENLKRYFGYLIGQKLEDNGYLPQKDEYNRTIRARVKGDKFFKMGTKFIKAVDNSPKNNENPFSKISGIASIGDLSDNELNSLIYNL